MVKFALLGAQGQVGRAVLDKALAKGHKALTLVDNLKELEPRENLTIIQGSFTHGPDILKLVKGGDAIADRAQECDVIVVALSDVQQAGRGEIITPALISLFVSKPKRIIVVTGNGVNAGFLSNMKLSLFPMCFGKQGSNGEYSTFKDLSDADQLVRQAVGRTSWLLIRPNNMKDEEKVMATWKYEATAKPGLRTKGISARDVAQFISDHLDDEKWDYCPVHLHYGNKNVFDGVKMRGGIAGSTKIEEANK